MVNSVPASIPDVFVQVVQSYEQQTGVNTTVAWLPGAK